MPSLTQRIESATDLIESSAAEIADSAATLRAFTPRGEYIGNTTYNLRDLVVDVDNDFGGGTNLIYVLTCTSLTSTNAPGELAAGQWALYQYRIPYFDTIEDLLAADPGVYGNVAHINGYHTFGDNAGGVFTWDAGGDKADHNGGTVIDPDITFPTDWTNQTQLATWFTAGTGAGVWRRQYTGAVDVKWFGAKGDGTTDDTKSMQQAFDFGYVSVPTGDFIVKNTLQLDVAKSKILGEVGSKIDFSLLSDAIGIKFFGSVSPPYSQNGNGLFDLEIVGDQYPNSTKTALSIDNSGIYSGSGGVAHVNIERCNIHKWGVGIFYGDNAYIIRHMSLDIFNCMKCLYSDGTNSDYGENWYYNGCTFYNSKSAADINSAGGTDLYFHSCSFDYNEKVFENINTALVVCTDCHFEYSPLVGDSLCAVSGNEGMFVVKGGILNMRNIASPSTARVGVINSASCVFSNVKIHNFGYSVSTPWLIECLNTTTVRVQDNLFLDTDGISRGMFSISAAREASYNSFIFKDSAPITKTKTGSNIVLSSPSGNQLSIQKISGPGTFAQAFAYVPARGANRMLFEVDIAAGGQTGDAFFEFGIADVILFDDNGLPRLRDTDHIKTKTITLGTTTTSETYIEGDNQFGHGYFYIFLNWDAVTGGGNTATLTINAYGI